LIGLFRFLKKVSCAIWNWRNVVRNSSYWLIALFFGFPISVGAALFLSYYAPNWLKKPMVLVIDVMAAIPSIVFGLWGYFILMPHAEYWAKLIHKYLGFHSNL
jgi:ABC-type phosphate transport system permease subunit